MAKTIPTAKDFDQRIVLREWSDVPFGASDVDALFGASLGRWARHEPVHSLAIRAGMQTGETPTDLFFVRRGPGTSPAEITKTHVVEYRGQRYRVVGAIDVDGRRRVTRIEALLLGPAS